MLNTWPQFQNNTTQQDSNTMHLFVYEEVWLKDLVPIPTNTAPITLRLSLSELASPVKTHCTQPKSIKTTPQHPINQRPTVNNFTTTSGTVQHNQQHMLPHVSKPQNDPTLFDSSDSIQDEAMLLSLICSTLKCRPRGRPKKTSFKVEFTEHVFSQLFNGKVKNNEGLKIKNRIIGKHLYQNIRKRKTY